MFKKLSDTLNALVAEYCVDDDDDGTAKDKGGRAAQAKASAVGRAYSAAPAEEPPVAPITRQELIRQAMEIRDAKARELESLPPAHRRRLRALAEKLMLGETADPDSRTGSGSAAESAPGAVKRRTRH